VEDWLNSYRPEELFDTQGRLKPELAELAPRGEQRMGANPHANGGKLLRDLRMPDFRDYAAEVPAPGAPGIGDTHVLGPFLRDVVKLNAEQRNFRVFGPDETLSNGLEALFDVTERQWEAATLPTDEWLAPSGRVMEMLSEHQCEGWLEGYLLTGRHGLFNCYEAFIHIVDSMFNQHAKWLKVTAHLPWRRKIASLNYLLASHVWRQDHNGFTHQDPGFIDQVVNKKAEVVRVYFPPDANCLLSVMDHCLRSRHYVNVVVAGKHPAPQWLSMDAAVKHCAEGIGIWQWASNDQAVKPDVVMACCGDVPTLETLAAVSILHEHLPDLKTRVVNVVEIRTETAERPDRATDSIRTGFLPSSGSGERVGALAQDCEIPPVTENAAPFSAGDLLDNAGPFQIGERRIDRGGRESRLLDELVGRQIGILLKQIVNTQRGARPIALRRDTFAVFLEQVDDPGGRVERLIGGIRDAREEEVEPGFPRAMLAHFLKQAVIVGAMSFEVKA
jgi:phosphoketolase